MCPRRWSCEALCSFGGLAFPRELPHCSAGVVGQPKTERLQFVQQKGGSLDSTRPLRVQEQAQGPCHLEAERSRDIPCHPIVQDDHGLTIFQMPEPVLRFPWPEVCDRRQIGRARGAEDLDPIQGTTSGRSRPSLMPSRSSSTTAGGTSTRVASDRRTSRC